MQCWWPTSEAHNNGLHQTGEVFLGGLNGAVTLLGAEVTRLVALRVPACSLTCAVQGAASPQGCLPPGGRREEGDACPHLTSWCVSGRGLWGPWSSPDGSGWLQTQEQAGGPWHVTHHLCHQCPAAFGEWEVWRPLPPESHGSWRGSYCISLSHIDLTLN